MIFLENDEKYVKLRNKKIKNKKIKGGTNEFSIRFIY